MGAGPKVSSSSVGPWVGSLGVLWEVYAHMQSMVYQSAWCSLRIYILHFNFKQLKFS